MSKILISYRRDDSQDVTGRIYDRLIQEFGQTAVFRDVDSIPYGVDFRAHVAQYILDCDVFLAVIGPRWLRKKSLWGQLARHHTEDFVRVEIEAALEAQIHLVPVLVNGAKVPASDQLPDSIQELSYYNAIELRSDPHFRQDMDRLIKSLTNPIPRRTPNHAKLVAVNSSVGYGTIHLRSEISGNGIPVPPLRVYLYVDDKEAGSVSLSKELLKQFMEGIRPSCDVLVPSGRHTVYAKYLFYKTSPLNLYISEGERIELRCWMDPRSRVILEKCEDRP